MVFLIYAGLAADVGRVAHFASFGLVLSGGGAKGAYEIGVWKALQEFGIASNITAISGTSVGALNAALFAAWPDDAEKLWMENVSGVFKVKTDRVVEDGSKIVANVLTARTADGESGVVGKNAWAALSAKVGKLATDFFSSKLQEGYLDSSLLSKMLEDKLPRIWPTNAPTVYVTAVEKGFGGKTLTWNISKESHERRVLMLRASAAIPFGFDAVMIDGKNYIDAGFEFEKFGRKILDGDNVPLQPIIDNHPEIKTVIVVYLADEKHIPQKRREKNRQAAAAAKVRLVEIVPTEYIGIKPQKVDGKWKVGGAMDTSLETAHDLIELGRKGAREALVKAKLISSEKGDG